MDSAAVLHRAYAAHVGQPDRRSMDAGQRAATVPPIPTGGQCSGFGLSSSSVVPTTGSCTRPPHGWDSLRLIFVMLPWSCLQ